MNKITKKLINWLRTAKILTPLRRFFGKLLADAIKHKGSIVTYRDPERRKVLDLINKIQQETDMLLDNIEAYHIFMIVKRTRKIKGELAEVGTYKGGSAKLICEARKDKILYLFDTFEGLPKVDKVDEPRFHKGDCAASIEEAREYLKDYKNVYFYKGKFPDTAESVKDKKFSFVHLDVDTHKSTLDCLKFFYPRMNQGGIILSHDYIGADGVRKAFDEFFENKPEVIIEMLKCQCLVTKL